MFARVWCGATTAEDAPAYLDYLERIGLAEYRSTAGNVGVLALRHVGGGRAEFVLLTLWDSMDAVRAVFYPEDDRFLVAPDEQVAHYEVVFRAPT